MDLTKADVEKLAVMLREAKPIASDEQRVSKQEAIRFLSKEIHELRVKGYTWERIAEMCKEGGVTISTATLKSYVARVGGATKRRSRQRGGTGDKPKRTTTQDSGGDATENAPEKAKRMVEKAKANAAKTEGTRAAFKIEDDNKDI